MTIDDVRGQRTRSIDETVAELTGELEHLRPTDRRRLKLAAMLTVLEDRIANRPAGCPARPSVAVLPMAPGDRQGDVDLARPSSVARGGIWQPLSRHYRAFATALNVLVRLIPSKL